MTHDDRDAPVPVNPVASARPEGVPDVGTDHTPAEQGPPPADFAQRPRSGVPVPVGDALPADEVAALTQRDSASTDANADLRRAEGRDTITES